MLYVLQCYMSMSKHKPQKNKKQKTKKKKDERIICIVLSSFLFYLVFFFVTHFFILSLISIKTVKSIKRGKQGFKSWLFKYLWYRYPMTLYLHRLAKIQVNTKNWNTFIIKVLWHLLHQELHRSSIKSFKSTHVFKSTQCQALQIMWNPTLLRISFLHQANLNVNKPYANGKKQVSLVVPHTHLYPKLRIWNLFKLDLMICITSF